MLADEADQLGPVPSLAGHRELRAFEQAGDSLAQEHVVVGQDHAGPVAHSDPPSPPSGTLAGSDVPSPATLVSASAPGGSTTSGSVIGAIRR